MCIADKVVWCAIYSVDHSQIHTLPSSPEVTHHISTLTEEMFLYSADVESGLVTGYHLEQNKDQVDKLNPYYIPPSLPSSPLL